MYTFVKRRYDYNLHYPAPDTVSANHKFWRLWQYDCSNSFGYAYNWGTSYQMRASYPPQHIDPNQPDPSYVIKLGWENFPAVGVWQTEEFFFRQETGPGDYDGVAGYRLNNNQHRSWATNRSMWSSPDYLPTHNKFYKLFIDNFSDHLSHESAAPGDYIWIDDVYVDKSWARVMICDSDTYDSCSRKMEIQPPVLWSDVSLTITFNAGEYSSGNTAYVYVFDGANRVSNGFEITID